MDDGAASTLVGGIAAGAGNTIADNIGPGVAVVGSTDVATIETNSIYGNSALGIDLGDNGVTPNHAGGPVSGPNGLIDYPILTSVTTNGSGQLTVAGYLDSAANTTYRLELFASTSPDPSGFGQGQQYLGTYNVTTNDSGYVSGGGTLPYTVAPGKYITTTVTDPSGNTSEFSNAVAARFATTTTLSSSVAAATYGQSVTFTATVTSPGTPTGTVAFLDGGTTIGNGTLSSGTATFTTSALVVGTHTVTAVYGGDSNDYGSTSSAVTETVTPAALTITAETISKVYGSSLPALTASYSGFVNGDTSASLTTAPTLATTATAASPVGSYGIAASGAVDANYSITYVAGTLTVTPATLTVTANDASKVYGTANPAFQRHDHGLRQRRQQLGGQRQRQPDDDGHQRQRGRHVHDHRRPGQPQRRQLQLQFRQRHA